MKIKSFLYAVLASAAIMTVSCGENEIPQVGPGADEGDPVNGTFFSETFSTAGSLGDFTIDNVNLPSGISAIWFSETYSSSTYAKGSTMKSSGFVECESWLISPEIDLSKAETAAVTFEHAHRFAGTPEEELTVWVKESSAGTWGEKLNITYSDQSSWNMVTTSSDISSFAGKKIKVGFCYKGTTKNNAGWEVCNFSVTAKATPSLNLLDPSLKVAIGDTVEIKYTTTSPSTVEFSSDHTDIATVDSKGLVTGVAEGTATITVKTPAYRSLNEVSRTIAITVQSEPVIDYISLPFLYSAEAASSNAAITTIEFPEGMTYDKDISADSYKCYSGYLGMRASNTAFIFKTNEAYGKITVTSKGNGSNNVYDGNMAFEGSTDGENYSQIADCKLVNVGKDSTYSVVNTNEAYRYLRLKYTKTTGNLGLKQIDIRVPGALDPCAAPSISLYRNVVTISCSQEGASIYYTLDGSDPTEASQKYTEPFAITSDVTVKAAAIAQGFSLSQAVSKACTFVQNLPQEITTAAALMALITSEDRNNPSTFEANLTDLVFTGFSGNNRFAEDATGGILFFMYNDKFSFKVGDKISGIITGSGYVYNGLPEITVADFSNVTKTTAETLPLTTVTLGDLLKDYKAYLSRRIKLEGVTVSKDIKSGAAGEISQNDTTISVKGAGDITLGAGSKGDMICHVTMYSGSNQLALLSQNDFAASEVAGQITLVASKSVKMGQTLQLEASCNSEAAITWASSDTLIAKVDQTGLVTPIAIGDVEIKASAPAADKGGIHYTAAEAVCKVSVKAAGTQGEGSVTWDLTKASYESTASASKVEWLDDNVTMTLEQKTSTSGANNYLGGTNQHTRFYKNQTLTFSPQAGCTILSISITATSSDYAAKWANTWTNATSTSSGATVTVTPTDGTKDVVFTVAEATRATSVTVNYNVK